MKTLLGKLYGVLNSKAGITPAEEHRSDNRVVILARHDRGRVASWMAVCKRLKQAEFTAPWSIDISKPVFLKNNVATGDLVFAWRIIVKSTDIKEALAQITSIIASSPSVRVELEEIMLPGGGQHRNYSTAGGKGAKYTPGSGFSGPSIGR